MNMVFVSAIGCVSAGYYAWARPSSKIGQVVNEVAEMVLPLFKRLGCYSSKGKAEVQRLLQEYVDLPREDYPFAKKIVGIYARTLIPEQQDILSQSQKENDAELISTIMILSWRALLFSPQMEEKNSPDFLKSYRGSGDAWANLKKLRNKFDSLSYVDQHVFLLHPNPDDISKMPVSNKAKEVYKGIKGIADRYIQGNTKFNECLGEVFKDAEKRGKILERDNDRSSTSANRWSWVFWLMRGHSRLEREFALYAGLPIGSTELFAKVLIRRYTERLPEEHRSAAMEEIRENEFYARQLLVMLSIRTLLCCPLREVDGLSRVMTFFNASQIRELKSLRVDFERLSALDQNYLFGSVFPPKDTEHPEGLRQVLSIVYGIMAETRVNPGAFPSLNGSSSSAVAAAMR